jgi:RHS repeat-associated protein
MGHLASITDPFGKVTQVTIDANGLVTSITDSLGGTTSLSYDGDGNLLSIADALGNARHYTYDAHDKITSMADPFGGVERNVYDNAGRLISHTNRTGDIITYAYDADGRLISRTLPGNDVTTLTYDAFGDVTSATNNSARLTFSYNDAGNLISTTSAGVTGSPQPSVTHAYTYDPVGNRLSVTGPGGTVRYGFDEDLRLRTITDPASGVFMFEYDPLNRLISVSRPNGIADSLAYTPSNELLSRDSTLGSLLVSRAAYGYDGFGRRISLTDLNGTSTFAYDDLGQLLSATHPAGTGLANESYGYDLAGNRTSSAGAPLGAWVYDRNRLMQDGSATYTYDAEGNQLTRIDRATGGVTRYTWNAEHRLMGVRFPDGSSESFRYDPLGRRIEIAHGTQATRYSYDSENIDAEYDAGNTLVATHLHAPAVDAILESARGGQRFYHHVDGLGSVTAITDQTGNVVSRYVYDAFGNQRITGSAVTPFSFTGREFDAATGLYYYRLRTYDPRIGRFLSEDPLPADNLYPYVSNNPVSLTDPSGAQEEIEEAGISEQQTALLARGEANVDAYAAVDETTGKCYFGITNNIVRRTGEHARNSIKVIKHFQLQIRRNEARVVEQNIFEAYGGAASQGGVKLANRISSIAEGGPLWNLVLKEDLAFAEISAAIVDAAAEADPACIP